MQDRAKEDRFTARQHRINSSLHPAAHFATDRLHRRSIVRGLWRIVTFHMQWLQKLRVPLRWQGQRCKREGRRDRETRPHALTLPPPPADLGEYREDLGAANRHKWDDRGRIAQGSFDIFIAPELAQALHPAIVREGPLDAFGKEP